MKDLVSWLNKTFGIDLNPFASWVRATLGFDLSDVFLVGIILLLAIELGILIGRRSKNSRWISG